MSPRLRLGAELSWLPGLAPNRAKQLIEGENLSADAIAGLPLLTGANLAAYRCSSRVVPVHHELLFRFYEQQNDGEVLTLVNSERRVANFPEVQLDLLKEIIPEVTEQHTDSFIEFVTREPLPGSTLLSVLKEHFVDGSNVIGFLDDLAQRFDDWAAGSFQQAEEAITKALDTIKEKPASLDQQLPAFTAAIGVWASVAAPHQFILARRHLNDPRTEQLLSKIRGVCLLLNNEAGDAKTPLALTKAALPAFVGSPGHHDTVTADLKTLEERVAQNDALELIKPLVDFVSHLKSRHSEICTSIRRGHFKGNGRGSAGKLFDLFRTSAKDLAGSQASAAPFRIILSLAIDLANDSQASEEALILIRALETFDDVPKDEQLVEALRSNDLIAHRTVLQKKLAQMAQAGRTRQSAALARQLADTATDDEDRAGWTKVRAQFEHRAGRWSRGCPEGRRRADRTAMCEGRTPIWPRQKPLPVLSVEPSFPYYTFPIVSAQAVARPANGPVAHPTSARSPRSSSHLGRLRSRIRRSPDRRHELRDMVLDVLLALGARGMASGNLSG
jgi:hypothetical protein